MKKLLGLATVALALGYRNIFRVIFYRIALKIPFSSVRRLGGEIPSGPFFSSAKGPSSTPIVVENWRSSALLFSFWPYPVGESPPDWFLNPFSGEKLKGEGRQWWEIPDFDAVTGDIKLIWELSRMDWVLAFAQRAKSGEVAEGKRLNNWLQDWCTCNPPFLGPNWKCGQEASIRVMHLAIAALILKQIDRSTPGLLKLVELHLRRIAPTVNYAKAQDNNHGTSEAAALYIGGSWLVREGIAGADQWQCTGVRLLEERVARLISSDGSFSQYSLNYHRMLVDTLSMVEIWRREIGGALFSGTWYQRAQSATRWLHQMINPINGDGPNLGANDGARIGQLTNSAYRDYRPSVQMASVLFFSKRAYLEEGAWNDGLRWLGVGVPAELAEVPRSSVFSDGGFTVLRRGSAMVMLRYPKFRFRPSQADALHLDFWLGAENLLRDAGTFSYNSGSTWLNYFGGTVSHNTVQFDDRDQMPRLGRFLFGSWLKTSTMDVLHESLGQSNFAAAYRDREGASHFRRILLGDENLLVEDTVSGFGKRAVLRWRLAPGPWVLDGNCIGNGVHVIEISSDVPIVRCELVEGWESRHYLEKKLIPVLEVEILQAGKLMTSLRWGK